MYKHADAILFYQQKQAATEVDAGKEAWRMKLITGWLLFLLISTGLCI
jgi:hypothetical protein